MPLPATRRQMDLLRFIAGYQIAHHGAFDLPDDEPNPGDLAADNSDDNADLTRKALDGTFEDNCPRELVGLGTRMMSRGAKLVAVGGRA